MTSEQIRQSKEEFETYAADQNGKTSDPQLKFRNNIQLAIVNLLGEIAAQLADLNQRGSQPREESRRPPHQ